MSDEVPCLIMYKERKLTKKMIKRLMLCKLENDNNNCLFCERRCWSITKHPIMYCSHCKRIWCISNGKYITTSGVTGKDIFTELPYLIDWLKKNGDE